MSITEGTVPWPDDLTREYSAAGWWRGRDLGAEIADVAVARPDATALVDGGTRIGYGSLLARADALAGRLARLGLRPGDRIVVQLPNCWQFVVLTLACLRAGIVPVMALPAHRRHELAYLCEHSEARALAVPDVLRGFDHQQMAEELLAASPTVDHILVAGQDVRHHDLTVLCSEGEGAMPVPPDPAGVAVFLLSGGTTGLPKLIARTHNDYSYNARASAEVCRLDQNTVYLVSLPASHNFPLACPGILGTLLSGGRVVMLGSPDPASAFAAIEGRDKDMINRGGEKISAEEVENLLYRMPGIAQVAAVAAPDAELGERICVFVVPEPGHQVSLAAISDGMAAAGVARFKWPERLETVTDLPVTKVGKLDKKALRERLKRSTA